MASSSQSALSQQQLDNIVWFQSQLLDWSVQNWRDFPWRKTADPYAVFVAESLLQKTDAAKVVPVYEAFLRRYPNFQTLAIAPLPELANLLKPLGLFFRAERLSRAARIVVQDWNGKLPHSAKALMQLPGIGKYSARAICANAFDMPEPILDTNVVRILERFFGLKGGRVKSRCPMLWQAAEQVAPTSQMSRWNLTLLDFGAQVCTARNPGCDRCPLSKKCIAFARSSAT